MSKGIVIPIQEVMGSLVVIAFIVLAIYIWKGTYFDVSADVQAGTDQRHIVTLGQILLSSTHLAISEDGRTIKDVLDPAKLDALVSSSQTLYQEVNYPSSAYKFTITDKINNKVWAVSPGQITYSVEYQRKFPLTIEYPNGQIDYGIMELKYYVSKQS